MVAVSVRADIKKAARRLEDIHKRQIPFAVSRALNDTAFDVRAEVIDQLPRHIDRPTSFTKRGFRVLKSSRSKLTAVVYIPPAQWRYMRFAVEGGAVADNRSVPVNADLNAYGNYRRNYLRSKGNRKNSFVGEVRGVRGVWERRRDGGLELIAAFEDRASYRPRFPFYKIATRQVARSFGPHLKTRLRQAIKTAR